MILICALSETLKFFRTLREPWILALILAFAMYFQDFFLSYPNNLVLTEEISKGFTWGLRSLLNIPFLFILAYVICVLTIWAFDFELEEKINMKNSVNTAVRRYPHLIASAIGFSLIVFLSYFAPIKIIRYVSLYLEYEIFNEAILMPAIESRVSFFLIVIVAIFSIYISIRLSLFYCFVVDGFNPVESLKLSWVTTKDLWKDLLILGFIFLILGQILTSIQFKSFNSVLTFSWLILEDFSYSIFSIGLLTSFAFAYVNKIKIRRCYKC